MTGRLSFNAKLAIFQPYYGENNIHFDDTMSDVCLMHFYSASSLKQQTASRNNAKFYMMLDGLSLTRLIRSLSFPVGEVVNFLHRFCVFVCLFVCLFVVVVVFFLT